MGDLRNGPRASHVQCGGKTYSWAQGVRRQQLIDEAVRRVIPAYLFERERKVKACTGFDYHLGRAVEILIDPYGVRLKAIRAEFARLAAGGQ